MRIINMMMKDGRTHWIHNSCWPSDHGECAENSALPTQAEDIGNVYESSIAPSCTFLLVGRVRVIRVTVLHSHATAGKDRITIGEVIYILISMWPVNYGFLKNIFARTHTLHHILHYKMYRCFIRVCVCVASVETQSQY